MFRDENEHLGESYLGELRLGNARLWSLSFFHYCITSLQPNFEVVSKLFF